MKNVVKIDPNQLGNLVTMAVMANFLDAIQGLGELEVKAKVHSTILPMEVYFSNDREEIAVVLSNVKNMVHYFVIKPSADTHFSHMPLEEFSKTYTGEEGAEGYKTLAKFMTATEVKS